VKKGKVPTFDVAVLPGDGIGIEIMQTCMQVLEVVQEVNGGFRLLLKTLDAGANYLSDLSLRFGSKLFAIAAYFQGPTKIRKKNNIPKKSVAYIERVLREEALIANSNELKRSGKCGFVTFQALFSYL